MLRRGETYAADGRLRLIGGGTIQIRRRYYKGRFSSRLFRAAVEILTRRRSNLRSIAETPDGVPCDVVLDCPNCRREAEENQWFLERSLMSVQSCPGDEADAEGECTGCGARVALHRDSAGAWRANIRDLIRHPACY